MTQISPHQVSPEQFYAFNGLCLIGLLWLLRKYRGDMLAILVVLLFFTGVVDDLIGPVGRNIYRIGLLVFCIWQSAKGALNNFYTTYPKVFYALCLYALYFVIDSIFINHDNYLLVFSLLAKILIPFLILTLMMERQSEDTETSRGLFWLFGDLIVAQIIISIGKMVILGGFLEGWVGSMTGIHGGGSGTSFPLLGLMWLALKTDMNFSRRDWLIAIGLLVLGFAAGKRAVWVMFPVLFVILSTVVYRRNMTKKIALLLALTPVLFYIALRISPTFNPEKKVWGSFDPEYAINFGLKYSGGIDENHNEVQSGVGRLGAITWMIDQFSEKGEDVMFGLGNEYMTYAGIDNYFNASYYKGIRGRGNITGIVSTFFTLGIIGIIVYLAFIVTYFSTNRSRFNLCLLFVVLTDYIFYNAAILNSIPLLMFAMFLSYFSPVLPDDDKENESIE